jgi:hypothetical protein
VSFVVVVVATGLVCFENFAKLEILAGLESISQQADESWRVIVAAAE